MKLGSYKKNKPSIYVNICPIYIYIYIYVDDVVT